MPKQLIQRIMAMTLAAVFLAGLSLAQGNKDNSALVGKWKMTSRTDQDAVSWILVLKDVDGRLTATLASNQGEAPVTDLTYAGGVLKFNAPYNGNDYAIELKLVGADLDGAWSGDGKSGSTHGVKVIT